MVAAVGTVIALVLTSIGRSPVAGPVEMWASALWAIGIVAGLTAFSAAASACSELARRRDDAPIEVHAHQRARHTG